MARGRAFGTVRKLPSGRYQARYSHLGRQIAADATFATKADARAWLATVETDLRRGDHFEPRAGTVRFGDYAEQWLDNRPVRPRTADTYRSQLTHILPTFGRAQLSDITPHSVRKWHGDLMKSGMNRNTAAKVYRLFRTIMSTAVDDGFVRTNPVAIKGAAAEHTIERPLLTWDDVVRLADSIEPRFAALVWTAAVSGLRFGELTALDRSRVNLDARTIRVDRALAQIGGEGPTFGLPKSDAAFRTVAIPEELCAVLRTHLNKYVDPAPTSVVFTSVKGSLLVNRYFAPYWHRAKLAADVDSSVRFHDLRHLAGTTAATAGASLREVMARMGHSSSDASLRYLKAAETRDRAIADAIGAHLPST